MRAELTAALGADGLREVASVAANFQRMVRVADATGIPQDAPVRALADDLITDLELRSFASSRNTPPPGALEKLLGGVFRAVARRALRRVSRRR